MARCHGAARERVPDFARSLLGSTSDSGDETWCVGSGVRQTKMCVQKEKMKRGQPGIEPGTSRTRSMNHPTRPLSQGYRDRDTRKIKKGRLLNKLDTEVQQGPLLTRHPLGCSSLATAAI